MNCTFQICVGTLVTANWCDCPQNAFLVDRETGVVRTQTQLSRDKVGEISFVAEVRDTQAQSPSVQTATGKVPAGGVEYHFHAWGLH